MTMDRGDSPAALLAVGFPPIGEKWKHTVVDLPESLSLENAVDILTGRETRFDNRRLSVADRYRSCRAR